MFVVWKLTRRLRMRTNITLLCGGFVLKWHRWMYYEKFITLIRFFNEKQKRTDNCFVSLAPYHVRAKTNAQSFSPHKKMRRNNTASASEKRLSTS